MTTVGPFDGDDYEPDDDDGRLTKQHERIKVLMLDGEWRTLAEIEEVTGDPGASVSAQLRHLRKSRFGSYVVEKRARGDRVFGLFEYRLLCPLVVDGSEGVELQVQKRFTDDEVQLFRSLWLKGTESERRALEKAIQRR